MITTLFERDVFPDEPGPWSRAGESRGDRVRSPLPLAHRAKRAPATVDRAGERWWTGAWHPSSWLMIRTRPT